MSIQFNNEKQNLKHNPHFKYKDGRGPPPKMKTDFGRWILDHPLQAQILYTSFIPIMLYIVANFFEFSFWNLRPILDWLFDFSVLETTPPFSWAYVYYTTLFQYIYDFDLSLYYYIFMVYILICVYKALKTLNNTAKMFDVNHNVKNNKTIKKVDLHTKQQIMDIEEEWQGKNKMLALNGKPKSKKALLKAQKKERLKVQTKKPGASVDEVEAGPSSTKPACEGYFDCACEACLNVVD